MAKSKEKVLHTSTVDVGHKVYYVDVRRGGKKGKCYITLTELIKDTSELHEALRTTVYLGENVCPEVIAALAEALAVVAEKNARIVSKTSVNVSKRQ